MRKVNSLKTPIYRDAGFYLKDADSAGKAFKDEIHNSREPETYIYSRYRNPTVVSVEKQIMELEESDWALLCESGMAAIDIALSIFQKGKDTGNWLFFSEIYGGTNSFIDQVLVKNRGLNIHRFYAANGSYDLELLEKLLNELKPELLYFEVISNPMLMVADAKAIISLAKDAGCRVIIDNTFSTPLLLRPLSLGADLIIHSATKYFSGHGNITAGVICGNEPKLMHKAIEYRKLVGHMLSPDDAYRLGTQLKTFMIRFERQCSNAEKLAVQMEKHPLVEKVLYPGLKAHDSHQVAKILFENKGWGAMITFELAGRNDVEKRNKRDLFMEILSERIHLIPSLGDTETILLPVEPVWGEKYPMPGMIRFSVGVEKPEELLKLISEALDKLVD